MKLSSLDGKETATVLTNGNVMASANDGAWRQIMSLEDWKCLAGENILMVPVPVQSRPNTFQRSDSVETLEAPIETVERFEIDEPVQAVQALPKRPVGTKLRWYYGESYTISETYRIAFVTKHGILQVKSVTDGAGECNIPDNEWQLRRLVMRNFATEEGWRASLPEGGHFTINEPSAKKLEVVPLNGASDVEKVDELAKRYKVRNSVYELTTPNKLREIYTINLQSYKKYLANSANTTDVNIKKKAKSYPNYIKVYEESIANIDAMTDEQKTAQKFKTRNYSSKQNLFVTLANGTQTKIWPSSMIDRSYENANVPLPPTIYCEADGKLYKSLSEMNVSRGVDGKPIIHAIYRKMVISLGHLF